MITISRDSWHYRLHSMLWKSEPSNLCSYFWRYLWMLILYASMGLVSCAAYFLVAFAFGVLVFVFLLGYSEEQLAELSVWTSSLAGTAVIAALIVMGTFIWVTCKAFIGPWLGRRTQRRAARPRAIRTPKEPSLVSEWLKARKNRYCPLITVE